MKKIFLVALLLFVLTLSFGCKDKKPNKKNELTTYLKNEKRACFDFFWETQEASNTNLKSYGLIPDRYPNNGAASIASVGFGLAGFVIGADSKYISKAEASERCYQTLVSLEKLDRVHGFYYHFYNYYTGLPSNNSEISVIDTALFIAGALTCGEYFGGKIKEIANRIYQSIEWNWYVNPNTNQFYMSHDPITHKFSGAWNYYAEQLLLYFLGCGSKNYNTGIKEYNAFRKVKGGYDKYNYITSWFDSIFTYQFSHAFIDFRGYVDSNNIDWWQNSVDATLAHQKYAIDINSQYRTLNKYAFGLTACDSPKGYNGSYGTIAGPGGRVDGTIAPAGALGSIVFTPDIVKSSCKYYSELLNGSLIGEYGLKDAYNLENNQAWIANDVIGIDKGITLLMIANYESEIVWESFMSNSFIKDAFKTLGFKKN